MDLNFRCIDIHIRNGRYFLHDHTNRQLKEIDLNSWTIIDTLAGQGSGPGEVQHLGGSWVNGDTLFVQDQRENKYKVIVAGVEIFQASTLSRKNWGFIMLPLGWKAILFEENMLSDFWQFKVRDYATGQVTVVYPDSLKYDSFGVGGFAASESRIVSVGGRSSKVYVFDRDFNFISHWHTIDRTQPDLVISNGVTRLHNSIVVNGRPTLYKKLLYSISRIKSSDGKRYYDVYETDTGIYKYSVPWIYTENDTPILIFEFVDEKTWIATDWEAIYEIRFN